MEHVLGNTLLIYAEFMLGHGCLLLAYLIGLIQANIV